MKLLGNILKEARKDHNYTLRYIEDTLGISNAYLNQLENNKIKKPSANILYKLSNLYKIPLKSLLGNAGIIEDENESAKKDFSEFANRIAFSAGDMSDEQKDKVLEYIKFIKSQKKS